MEGFLNAIGFHDSIRLSRVKRVSLLVNRTRMLKTAITASLNLLLGILPSSCLRKFACHFKMFLHTQKENIQSIHKLKNHNTSCSHIHFLKWFSFWSSWNRMILNKYQYLVLKKIFSVFEENFFKSTVATDLYLFLEIHREINRKTFR